MSKSTSKQQPMVQAQQMPSQRNAISEDQIARRAYELFLERGGEHGHDREDWMKAESELRLQRQLRS